jgi:hypothetical protein
VLFSTPITSGFLEVWCVYVVLDDESKRFKETGCQMVIGPAILSLLPGCALCMLKVVVGASLAAFEFFLIVGGDAPVVRLCRAMAL